LYFFSRCCVAVVVFVVVPQLFLTASPAGELRIDLAEGETARHRVRDVIAEKYDGLGRWAGCVAAVAVAAVAVAEVAVDGVAVDGVV
jgi:hypothetical protein